MCDWFEVRPRDISSIFSQIKERFGEAKEPYSCTVTEAETFEARQRAWGKDEGGISGQAYKCTRWMPRHGAGDEGRGKLR